MLNVGDSVSLVERWGEVAAGAVGQVAALYSRPTGREVVVEFPTMAVMIPERVLRPAVAAE